MAGLVIRKLLLQKTCQISEERSCWCYLTLYGSGLFFCLLSFLEKGSYYVLSSGLKIVILLLQHLSADRHVPPKLLRAAILNHIILKDFSEVVSFFFF